METNLEFDPRYLSIEATLNQLDALDASDLAASPAPDWDNLATTAQALLDETPDLHVALWLMRAQLHTVGLAALFDGLARIADVLERRGDSPQSADALALAWLQTQTCLSAVRSARLVNTAPETTDDLLQRWFAHQVEQDHKRNAQPLLCEQFQQARQRVLQIQHEVNRHATDYVLDCSRLLAYFDQLNESLTLTASAQDDSLVDALSTASAIHSRQEALLQLQRIVDYFERHEPSHPAPLLMRRVQRLIGLNFQEILQDLLPEAEASFSKLTGSHPSP